VLSPISGADVLPDIAGPLNVTIGSSSSNQDPVIDSKPTATPNPVDVGGSVSFSVSASDPDGDGLNYAWDFGDGTTGSGANAQHAYAAAGTFTATVAVADGNGGLATANVQVTVQSSSGAAPVIDLPPFAIPNPALVNQNVTFFVPAHDPDGDPLNYDWDFGDGSAAGGVIVTHAYASAGDYKVTVAVSDGASTVKASVTVSVTSELTQSDTAPAPQSGAQPLSVDKFRARAVFGKDGRDSVSVIGTLNLPAGFDCSSKAVGIDIGGAKAEFLMDSRCRGRSEAGLFKVKLKPRPRRGESFAGGQVAFRVKLRRGRFAQAWQDHGMVNADVPTDSLTMPVTVIVEGAGVYQGVSAVTYKAKEDRKGTARSGR
jgi:PKD repeat protein